MLKTSNEKWNLICDYFDKNKHSPEQRVQNIWEKIFSELLNFSQLQEEIDIHRSLRIGSIDRVIPDIIIKNKGKDLFVVELKQHNHTKIIGMENQLFSYLKLLQNDLGILICDKMYVFDYDYQKNDEEQNKIEIEGRKDNRDGIKGVELFNKYNFNKDDITKFIQNKNEAIKNIEIIKNKISVELIQNLLLKHFLEKFNRNIFDEAIKNFSITVAQKNTTLLNTNSNSLVSKTPHKINHKKKLTKSEAIALCRRNELKVRGAITFASENSTSMLFWANPNKKYLSDNWWLLLNDISNKKLYVFFIPNKSLDESQI